MSSVWTSTTGFGRVVSGEWKAAEAIQRIIDREGYEDWITVEVVLPQ
ncbi:hypothetical protein [Mycolicibacterium houstonense]